jgi:phage/plasmid-associated DNA primase
LKSIFGNDAISIEEKNIQSDGLKVNLDILCFVATNHLPKFLDDSNGTIRRLTGVVFKNNFKPDPLIKMKTREKSFLESLIL